LYWSVSLRRDIPNDIIGMVSIFCDVFPCLFRTSNRSPVSVSVVVSALYFASYNHNNINSRSFSPYSIFSFLT
jgi:hypothetical protein